MKRITIILLASLLAGNAGAWVIDQFRQWFISSNFIDTSTMDNLWVIDTYSPVMNEDYFIDPTYYGTDHYHVSTTAGATAEQAVIIPAIDRMATKILDLRRSGTAEEAAPGASGAFKIGPKATGGGNLTHYKIEAENGE